jgi:hypothetical protein
MSIKCVDVEMWLDDLVDNRLKQFTLLHLTTEIRLDIPSSYPDTFVIENGLDAVAKIMDLPIICEQSIENEHFTYKMAYRGFLFIQYANKPLEDREDGD